MASDISTGAAQGRSLPANAPPPPWAVHSKTGARRRTFCLPASHRGPGQSAPVPVTQGARRRSGPDRPGTQRHPPARAPTATRTTIRPIRFAPRYARPSPSLWASWPPSAAQRGCDGPCGTMGCGTAPLPAKANKRPRPWTTEAPSLTAPPRLRHLDRRPAARRDRHSRSKAKGQTLRRSPSPNALPLASRCHHPTALAKSEPPAPL